MPSHKSFKVKRLLAKKAKQNRPIPQWIRMRTDNTIRYNFNAVTGGAPSSACNLLPPTACVQLRANHPPRAGLVWGCGVARRARPLAAILWREEGVPKDGAVFRATALRCRTLRRAVPTEQKLEAGCCLHVLSLVHACA
eukprot:CAMPEP_0116927026 /NCGR_PEP_ID=MMETSP0467-20121206/25086_1 /TAXON_ID=283647 /ORGANISM="Mesodinium pulex, Strain SPMC105" /LENGTH=138 /DNA_ID=CAMNT_0004606417 /DNA_START=54 /DNA_END=471 /DNA_ORIENTATION=+